MAVKGFTFYLTYWDVGNEISEECRGLYYSAIADYMFADIDRESELPFEAKVAFKAVKANLKTSKNRSEVGKKGLDKRWNSKKDLLDSKTIANHSKPIASSSSSSISSSSSRPMSNSAQSTAPKFDRNSGSGAEEAAAADAYDWTITDSELKELVQSWR